MRQDTAFQEHDVSQVSDQFGLVAKSRARTEAMTSAGSSRVHRAQNDSQAGTSGCGSSEASAPESHRQ